MSLYSEYLHSGWKYHSLNNTENWPQERNESHFTEICKVLQGIKLRTLTGPSKSGTKQYCKHHE